MKLSSFHTVQKTLILLKKTDTKVIHSVDHYVYVSMFPNVIYFFDFYVKGSAEHPSPTLPSQIQENLWQCSGKKLSSWVSVESWRCNIEDSALDVDIKCSF